MTDLVISPNRVSGNSQWDASGLPERLVQFIRLLRDNGFKLDVSRSIDIVKVLAQQDVLKRHKFQAYLRALSCKSAAELKRFDEIYNAYWRGHVGQKRTVNSNAVSASAKAAVEANTKQGGGIENSPGLAQYFEWRSVEQNEDADLGVDNSDGEEEQSSRLGGASGKRSSETTDFATIADKNEAQHLLDLTEELAKKLRYRLSRRKRSAGKGNIMDLRRALRQAASTGGLPMKLPRKQRKAPPINVVSFVDVSGSMDAHSLFFVRFIQALSNSFNRAESFLIHTRLVHISDAFKSGKADVVADKLSLMSQGWSGGTRLGSALQSFNTNYAQKYLNSKSVILLMTDGFDTDEPQVLEAALKQLKGVGYKIVWLNPFAGKEGYAPKANGTHLLNLYSDVSLPCHNLQSLLKIEEVLTNG